MTSPYMLRRAHGVLLVFALVAGSACTREAPAVVIVPATDVEVKDFTAELLAAMERGDAAAIADSIDVVALVELATLGSDKAMHPWLIQGLLTGFARDDSVPVALATAFGDGKSVKVFPSGGPHLDRGVDERWITVRLVAPEGPFDHVALRLGTRDGGKTSIVDFMTLGLGERFSSTIGATLAAQRRSSGRARLLRRLTLGLWREDVFDAGIAAGQEMRQLVSQGDATGALEHFAALPERVKQQRIPLLTRLFAAQQVDDASTLRALEDLKTYLPDDPAWLLSSLEYYTLEARYDDALASLARLRARCIDDANIDVHEADLLMLAKRHGEAEAALARARAKEPDLVSLRWSSALLLVHQRKFDEAAATYGEMIEKHGLDVDVDAMATLDGFEDFAASPAYARLVERFGEGDDDDEDDEDASTPPELVKKVGVVREPGYLYYIDKSGDVARTRMVRGGERKAPSDAPELVAKTGVKRQEGFLYFIDKHGDIARVPMQAR